MNSCLRGSFGSLQLLYPIDIQYFILKSWGSLLVSAPVCHTVGAGFDSRPDIRGLFAAVMNEIILTDKRTILFEGSNKLLFLSFFLFLTGSATTLLPFMNSMTTLLTARFLQVRQERRQVVSSDHDGWTVEGRQVASSAHVGWARVGAPGN
jgi:hypothetical protein